MDEYKSRLSTYLSDMVREELKNHDSGFTDEMNAERGKNAEVLGYKLSGTSDVKEEKKMKDKRTNKAYNPDKMFDKAINHEMVVLDIIIKKELVLKIWNQILVSLLLKWVVLLAVVIKIKLLRN